MCNCGLLLELAMLRVIFILDKICVFGAALACVACFMLAVMLIFEVITTSFFSYSQPWAVEFSGYLLAIILFSGSGYTLGKGGHIRVNILLQFFSSKKLKIIDFLMSCIALCLALFVAIALTENTLRSVELGSVSYYPTRTPIWIPQLFLSLGWSILCLGLISRLLRLTLNFPAQTESESSER